MKVFIHDHIHRETEPEVRITLAEAQELYAQLFEVLFHCKPDREAIADASRPSEPITQYEIDAWLHDGGRQPDDSIDYSEPRTAEFTTVNGAQHTVIRSDS